MQSSPLPPPTLIPPAFHSLCPTSPSCHSLTPPPLPLALPSLPFLHTHFPFLMEACTYAPSLPSLSPSTLSLFPITPGPTLRFSSSTTFLSRKTSPCTCEQVSSAASHQPSHSGFLHRSFLHSACYRCCRRKRSQGRVDLLTPESSLQVLELCLGLDTRLRGM